MKTRYRWTETGILLIALCMAVLSPRRSALAAAPPPSRWSAVITNSDGVLRAYGFPSKIVQITFPKSFPTNAVKTVGNYELVMSDAPTEAMGMKREVTMGA